MNKEKRLRNKTNYRNTRCIEQIKSGGAVGEEEGLTSFKECRGMLGAGGEW